MSETTLYACWRVSSAWPQMAAATLATAIVQPVALRRIDRKTLFGAVVQAGGAASELRQLYGYSAYMADVEAALANGDLAAAQGLVALCPVDLGPATQGAIHAVLAAHTLRLVDVVAAGQCPPTTAPAQLSAADVTAAFAEAGYVWNGTAWIRS